ncbi:MAG: purine-nucleoside phosphorylase [Pseudomonadota bacterium]
MDTYKKKVAETARFLEARTALRPRVGFLTGTGLGNSTAAITVTDRFDCRDLPHFPVSTVVSHSGELLLGTLAGCPVVAMKGRIHLYEGYSPLEVTFPIRVMQSLGVRVLIISNASGGLNLSFVKGDIMVIRDHINLTGLNPLTGPNVDAWGERFPDMTRVYDPGLASLAETAATDAGFTVRKGVYAGLAGPSLETPAETRYLGLMGCDAVGFSTVMEAIAGVHAGMKILGMAVITNVNDPARPEKASVPDIIKTAEQAAAKIGTIAAKVIRTLDWTDRNGSQFREQKA